MKGFEGGGYQHCRVRAKLWFQGVNARRHLVHEAVAFCCFMAIGFDTLAHDVGFKE